MNIAQEALLHRLRTSPSPMVVVSQEDFETFLQLAYEEGQRDGYYSKKYEDAWHNLEELK